MSLSLSEIKEHIAHHGEMQTIAGQVAAKEGRMDEARRCADRADCAANEGRLLLGDQESRDAHYSMGHQNLIDAAISHGLVKYDHAEPK